MASLPYPRSHKTIFPQNPTQPNHLCASVKSVGGSSPPEASVNSVNSVGEYPPPEASVNSVNSVGGLAQTNLEWVLWKEFGGLRGYGRDAIPTQPPNYLPTEFTEHTETTGGEEKSVYICEIRGRLFYARSFCVFCEFRGRTIRSLTICVHLCASVGGYSPPEASVYPVQSVGEYPPPEASVNSVNSVGGLAQTNLEWVLWKEFGGRRGYGRDAIPSYENSHGLHGCAQIRRQNAT